MRRKAHSAKMVYHSGCISLFHCSWVSKALITEMLPLGYITELSANPIGLLVGKQKRNSDSNHKSISPEVPLERSQGPAQDQWHRHHITAPCPPYPSTYHVAGFALDIQGRHPAREVQGIGNNRFNSPIDLEAAVSFIKGLDDSLNSIHRGNPVVGLITLKHRNCSAGCISCRSSMALATALTSSFGWVQAAHCCWMW